MGAMDRVMDWILALGTLGLAVLTAVNVRLTREVIRAPWRSVFRLRSFHREGGKWVAEIENLGPGPAAEVEVLVMSGGASGRSQGAVAMRGPAVVDSNERLRFHAPVGAVPDVSRSRLVIRHRTVCGERRELRLSLEEPENRPWPEDAAPIPADGA